MKHTLHVFFITIFLLSGINSFGEKKSNDNFVCPTASISYAGNPFCTSIASPQAVTLTGTDAYLGGVFSSTPGLTINSVTGEISLITSMPGTYTVVYTIPSGPGCSGIAVTTSVAIYPQVNAGTDSSATICESSTVTIPLYSLIIGEQTGGTWTRTSGTGGTFNAVSATFTPAMGATSSTFMYTVNASAPCSDDLSIATININPQPYAGTDGSTTMCESSTATINLFNLIIGEHAGGTWVRTSGTGGTFNAVAGTFTLSFGATSSTFSYTLTSSAPCINDMSVATVNIGSVPTGISISGGTTTCSGTPVNLTITGTPNAVITMTDGSISYTYTIGSSGVIIIPVTPTVTSTYSLLSASLNGCSIPLTQSTTVVVSATPQLITQIPDIIICNGSGLDIASQLTSTIPGTTFIWSATTTNVNMSAINGDQTNIDQIVNLINPLVNGSITIQVLPKIGNCYGNPQQIEVTVKPIPVITSTVANHTVICNNQFVTITTNSEPYTTVYNWQVNPATTNGVQIVGGAINGTSLSGIINVQLALTNSLVPGTISFDFTPVNGFCYGSEIINAVTITVNPIPGTPIALPINEICSGDATNLIISSDVNITGTMLEWTVIDSQNVSGFSNGTGVAPLTINDLLDNTSYVQGYVKYSVTTKLGDCEGGTTEYIVNVNPLPNISNLTDGEITIDGNGNLIPYIIDTGLDTSNYSFEWYLNNILLANASSSIYTATEVGNYIVRVTNLITGCENYGNVLINLLNDEESTDLAMYPNPSFDTINFSYNSKVTSIQISNHIGQIVLTKDINLKNGTIDLSDLNMGIYNIQFETESGTVNQRIIKQ